MYDARLLLIGRSELSEPRRRELEKLEGQVRYLPVDVSRLEGATQAVRDAKGNIRRLERRYSRRGRTAGWIDPE